MVRTRPTYQRSTQHCVNAIRPTRDTLGARSPIITQDLDRYQIRRFSNPKPFSSGNPPVSESVSG